MKKRVLITGASGMLGPRIVEALYAAGYIVRTYSLDTSTTDAYPAEPETIIGDICNPDELAKAIKEIDFVVHMAALLHIENPPLSMRQKYESINVDGTRNVVQAALRGNVKKIVYLSTIAVYGPGKGKLFSEESAVFPDTMYAETKLAGEKIVLEAKRKDGERLGVVLRLGAVYGTRIKGNYQSLVKSLARHRFIPVGKGTNRRTLIYDRDVARAAILAIEHPASSGKIFNVTDGRIYSVREIIEQICQALGRSFPRFRLPVCIVGMMLSGMERVMGLLGRQTPATRAKLEKYIEDVAVDGSRIQRELGFIPRYSMSEGWQEVIGEMRSRSEI